MTSADKPTYPLALAREQADAGVHELAPACERIQIAGSIRRKSPQVHDIDLVIWPKTQEVETGQPGLFEEASKILLPVQLIALLSHLDWQHDAQEGVYPRKITLPPPEIIYEEGEIIPVELYICEPDGGNFEALLQMRTGCEQFNISLATRAKDRLGLKYSAGYGIFKGNQRMDDGTEDGIFRALGIEPIPPERRTCDFHLCAKEAKV
jgi:DNA polymerase/3'-5' exonuclease PolX